MTFKKSIFLFALIGLLLGYVLDYWITYQHSILFYPVFISAFCYLYVLAYNGENVLRLIGTSFIAALVLSIPLIGINLNDFHEIDFRLISFLIAYPVFIYIGHCFHYAYHHDNSLELNYSTLFAAVWNTILILLVAMIFAFLSNMLLMLAAFIFKTVGNYYLWNIFIVDTHFRLILNTTLFFIGVGVAQQNIEIIYSIRFLVLKMMYFLFPLLALISIIYFILYLINSFSVVPEVVDPVLVLLPLIILGIIFFNAYFQDGTTDQDIPAWLKIFLRVYRVILFILVLMLSYKLLQKTPLSFNCLIYLFMAVLLSFIYAVTALFSEEKEDEWITTGNVGVALLFMAVLFFSNLPYIPVQYTTNQYTAKANQPPVNTTLSY